jgi:hypothetical protein
MIVSGSRLSSFDFNSSALIGLKTGLCGSLRCAAAAELNERMNAPQISS